MPGIFLGLGSNLGDRKRMLDEAIVALGRYGIKTDRVSTVYETSAVGPIDQPDFLNVVVDVSTDLSLRELLDAVKGIERDLGRESGPRWGPRVIDIDLLLFGDQVVDEPDLVVPHPELTKRQFVLVPLLEIAPDAALPTGERLDAFLDTTEDKVEVFR